MSTTFRPYEPDQMLLLPADLRAWLPEGHLAHHVSDLVDGLDLTAFYGPYEGDGRRNAPYEPRMMVKVLVYAYATGVFSSRGIARKLEEDVAFRVLGAGNFPQHRTLCEFRRRHLSDFRKLFVEVVRLARELGLASFGKLSIDGTKVRANASRRKAMSYGRMVEEERRLSGEIEALLATAGEADAAEDAQGDVPCTIETQRRARFTITHPYSDDFPSPRRTSCARRSATSAGISWHPFTRRNPFAASSTLAATHRSTIVSWDHVSLCAWRENGETILLFQNDCRLSQQECTNAFREDQSATGRATQPLLQPRQACGCRWCRGRACRSPAESRGWAASAGSCPTRTTRPSGC